MAFIFSRGVWVRGALLPAIVAARLWASNGISQKYDRLRRRPRSQIQERCLLPRGALRAVPTRRARFSPINSYPSLPPLPSARACAARLPVSSRRWTCRADIPTPDRLAARVDQASPRGHAEYSERSRGYAATPPFPPAATDPPQVGEDAAPIPASVNPLAGQPGSRHGPHYAPHAVFGDLRSAHSRRQVGIRLASTTDSWPNPSIWTLRIDLLIATRIRPHARD
jgi:hypothetical protein